MMHLPEVQQDAGIRMQDSPLRRDAPPPVCAKRVTIVGAGYVGLNTRAVLAYLGHQVTLVDQDEERVALLRAGQNPIFEHGLQELLLSVRANTTYSLDLAYAVEDADLIVIAVGTPTKPNGEADTLFVEVAALAIADGLRSGREHVIVVKSTVPIGTGRRVQSVVERRLQQRGVGR